MKFLDESQVSQLLIVAGGGRLETLLHIAVTCAGYFCHPPGFVKQKIDGITLFEYHAVLS